MRAPLAAANREATAAGQAYAAAQDALDDTERPRWEAFCDLWIVVHAGMATEREQRKVAVTLAAYKDSADDRITSRLRRCWAAWEGMWWADKAALGIKHRLEAQLAQLALCLEALGRQDEADALYTEKPRRNHDEY